MVINKLPLSTDRLIYILCVCNNQYNFILWLSILKLACAFHVCCSLFCHVVDKNGTFQNAC